MLSYRLANEDDSGKWNQFVASEEMLYGGLLQSWEWGEFQKSIGNHIMRFVVEDENGWVMTAFVVELTLPLQKRILYIPRGPVFQKDITKLDRIKFFGDFFLTLQKEYSSRAHLFVRVDFPWKDDGEEIQRRLREAHGYSAYRSIQPRETLFVYLDKPEEILWKELKQKTRYNIQVAKRHEIKIRNMERAEDFNEFFLLLSETAKRDAFFLHKKKYYQNMLKHQNELFIAEANGVICAGAIIGFFGGMATYLHGASRYESRALMASYLLHWEIILTAKKRNSRAYDLNGIREGKGPQSWEGITRFKRGFAPKEPVLTNIGTWEFPLNPLWYQWYHLRDWWNHSSKL